MTGSGQLWLWKAPWVGPHLHEEIWIHHSEGFIEIILFPEQVLKQGSKVRIWFLGIFTYMYGQQ